MMTKQQMQIWVGLNCKFAMADRFVSSFVDQIVKTSKTVSGEQFVNLVMAVLKTKIAFLPHGKQIVLEKALRKIMEGKPRLNGEQMKAIMMEALVGKAGEQGLAKFFSIDPNDVDVQNVIKRIVTPLQPRQQAPDRPEGTGLVRKRQEGEEAKRYMGEGGPKVHFTKPKK